MHNIKTYSELISNNRKANRSSVSQNSLYKAGGYDQTMCHLGNMGELESFLSEESLIVASKHFNLRLMRKGATIYSHYHCFDLVDNLLKK